MSFSGLSKLLLLVLLSSCATIKTPESNTINIYNSRHDISVATYLDEEHKGKQPLWEPIIGMKLYYPNGVEEILNVVYVWDEAYGKFALTPEILRGDLRLIEESSCAYRLPGEMFTIKIWFDETSWYCLVDDDLWFLGHWQDRVIKWELKSWCKSQRKFVKKNKFRFTWN